MNTRRRTIAATTTLLGMSMLATLAPVAAQAPSASERLAAWDVAAMRQSPGIPLRRVQSRHFQLYTEYDEAHAVRMLDSLEAALAHAHALLGTAATAADTLTVFVTASRTRFPLLLSPTNKGVRVQANGRDLIALVVNDSVRSYARHEVMHAVAFRVWGARRPPAKWMVEGLATFADGLCQGVPIAIVARDLLRQEPMLTVREVTEQFSRLAEVDRAKAYVLASSVIAFLWQTRGREGVQRVWQGTDSLGQPALAALGLGNAGADLTPAWRSHTEQIAGAQPGVRADALRRHGCG